MNILNYLVEHGALIATILFLISEIIGENQNIAANSVFSLIRNFLKGHSIKAIAEDLDLNKKGE